MVIEDRRTNGGGPVAGNSHLADYCREVPITPLTEMPTRNIHRPTRSATGSHPGLFKDQSGTSAVEFALVAPLFLLLVCGILVYGVWFSLALSVQTLASESARAALAGVDPVERRELALAYVADHAASTGLSPLNLSQFVDVTPSHVRVTVRFDATQHPVMAMRGLIPSPPVLIQRSAVVDGV